MEDNNGLDIDKIALMAEPIDTLIKHAKECDAHGKTPSGKAQLIDALMTLGRSRKEAERALEVARVRVRKSARKAERRLEILLRDERLWSWTEPEEAIKQMRSAHFGCHENAPLTDIELALAQAGNVLWIIAVYPTLAMPILARLGRDNTAKAMRTTGETVATHGSAVA